MSNTDNKIGPYEIRMLTVREGLHLMDLAHKGDEKFRTELLLACVRISGKPVDETNFCEFIPHMAEIVNAAMTLNGFSVSEADSEK